MQRHFEAVEKSRCLEGTFSKVFIQREPTSGIPKSARPGKLLPAWLRASTQHAWMVGVGGAECGTQGCNPENWGKTPGVSFH